MKDLTKNYDYEKLIEEEKSHYSEIEVTEKLTEGGKHTHNAWEYYWQRVGRNISDDTSPFSDVIGYLEKTIPESQKIRVLSLGSGYCGQEIILAEQFSRDYEILCVDINDSLFSQAKKKADDKNLCLSFEVQDLNFINILPGYYDLIFAHAVLHHVINLEHLFSEIAHGLTDLGIFNLIEVIGENRRLLWEKNQTFINTLLNICPDELVLDDRIYVTGDEEGMEGVRQEEILPLLRKDFFTEYEHLHGAFMRFVCLDERLGPRFDPLDELAKKHLDFLIDCDESTVRHGVLNPLELWGVYRSRKSSQFSICGSKLLSGDCLVRAEKQQKRFHLPYLFEHLILKSVPELLRREAPPMEYQLHPLDRLDSFIDVKGKRVLEIGADDGVLLSRLVEKGMHQGFGINNWYWEERKDKILKVSDQIILSHGDIRHLPLVKESFDLIFTVAAFEHIHDFETALAEMYRLLKPGGLVYSYYGPLWSSGIGHHLWFERGGKWYRFTEEDSTAPILQNHEHLLLDRKQMAKKLSADWDRAAVDDFVYQIYDNNHINRYMYADYIKMFNRSDFEVVSLENFGKMIIEPAIAKQLCSKFGDENDFTCATLEVVLKKPDKGLFSVNL